MKNYNNKPKAHKLVRKYRVLYFLSFASGFVLLFAIVGIALFSSITNSFYRNAQRSIDSYIINFVNDPKGDKPDQKPEKNGGGDLPPQDGPTEKYPQVNDPTMIAVLYYENENGDIEEFEILGAFFNQRLADAITEDFQIDNPLNDYYLTTINNFYYMSYCTEVTKTDLQKEGMDGYIKLYCNINNSIVVRNRIIGTYIMGSIVSLILSLVLGYFMMKEGTKPLELFVTKQTNFVSDASHELRTPLAVVRSKIENVLSQPSKTVYEVSEDLAVALNELTRLTKLTQELLTLARNDRETIQINYSVFDLDEALEEIIEPFIEIGALNDRSVSYEGSPCYVYLDKDKLKQIIVINIDNALKYTEAGDAIKVSLRVLKDEVQIQIADTGIGLSDESKRKVFDRFYREDKARSRETGGNGLGLSIAYTLCKLQKGRIEVYDNIPKGTRFVIVFPKATQKQIQTNTLRL